MKKLLAFLLTFALLFSLSACGSTETVSSAPESNVEETYTPVDISVSYMTGPTGIGMAKLHADSNTGKTENNYTFKVAATADEFKADFLKGNINIVSVPTNVAAALYKATGGKVRMLAVNTNGVLSILENGDTIKSIDDLKGKTIYSTGKGQNPEYILKYILEKNNIDPEKDVTINFVAADELAKEVIKGNAQIAVAPEPLATTIMSKSDKINRVISINDEWSKVSDNELMMGCVIALDDFINANPEAIEKFLSEYKNSINFAKENINTAATYCQEFGIVADVEIAKTVIPNSNLCFVVGDDMKNSVNDYLEVLFNADPTSIGGAMPADDLYYTSK